jgi:hypothetical protein
VFAVGNYGFTLVKGESLLRPEHSIAKAVGHVDKAVLIQANDSRSCDVEVTVMLGDDRIAGNRIPQFGGAFYAARNHGIGIYRAG